MFYQVTIRWTVNIKALASGVYQVSAAWNNGEVNKIIALVKQ